TTADITPVRHFAQTIGSRTYTLPILFGGHLARSRRWCDECETLPSSSLWTGLLELSEQAHQTATLVAGNTIATRVWYGSETLRGEAKPQPALIGQVFDRVCDMTTMRMASPSLVPTGAVATSKATYRNDRRIDHRIPESTDNPEPCDLG